MVRIPKSVIVEPTEIEGGWLPYNQILNVNIIDWVGIGLGWVRLGSSLLVGDICGLL